MYKVALHERVKKAGFQDKQSLYELFVVLKNYSEFGRC